MGADWEEADALALIDEGLGHHQRAASERKHIDLLREVKEAIDGGDEEAMARLIEPMKESNEAVRRLINGRAAA